jgi:hypothetical protein
VVIKSRVMKWTRHVVRVVKGEIGKTRTLEGEKPKGKKTFRRD